MSSVFKKLQKRSQLHSNFDQENQATKKQKLESDSEVSEGDSNGPEEPLEVGSDSSSEKEPVQESSEDGDKSKESVEKEEEDPEDELRAFADVEPLSKEWKNRQRVMMVCQRGIEGKFRHLMEDLVLIIPHSKKESKIEKKQAKEQIDELCYERSCNNFIYFESRSHKDADLYMWLPKSPAGPSFKFNVKNISTLDEYKLSGNCLKYGRPIMSFDNSFDDPTLPHLQLAKELFNHCFNTPKNHPKSKPFFDHVIALNYFQEKIYFRHYQVLNQQEEKFTEEDDIEKLVLIEIGPRFTMDPIKAFEGSIGGAALWQNANYIAPAKIRGKKMDAFQKKRDYKENRKEYKEKVIAEGKDPNAYLGNDAFDFDSGESEKGKNDDQSEGSFVSE